MTSCALLRRGAYRGWQVLKAQNSYRILRISRCHESSFVPKRVLILKKVSRYDVEKRENPMLNNDQFKHKMQTRGTNFDALIAGHQRNRATVQRVIETLKYLNIPYIIKDRFDIDDRSILWADLIMAVGGDGTFLLASNLIADNTKRILGINSDPEFSEGYLMLPSKYTNNIPEVFERLKSGEFQYLMRSRIRITLEGENIWQVPFHMHEQKSVSNNKNFYVNHHEATKPKGVLPKTRVLPWLALNEVFLGETLSSRISILYLNFGDDVCHKVKSSGICVTTGTGSSSWYRAINSLSPQTVKDVFSMAGYKNNHTREEIQKICFDFNKGIQYPADQLRLSYAIRDMIVKHTWPLPNSLDPRGFCKVLSIKSHCCDGGLVLDGGIAVHFNIGTSATLSTCEEDTLCNIVLPD